MPALHIANCTKQNRTIHFRTDFRQVLASGMKTAFSPASRRDIKPGQQVKIEADSVDGCQAIIEQLQVYGMIGVEEISRTRHFVPLICNTGKAITAHQIRQVLGFNSGIRQTEGRDRRQKAAIAVNEAVLKAVAANLTEQQIPVPDNTQMEVEFETASPLEEGDTRVEEGFKLDEQAPPPARAQAPARPRRQRGKG
jgi:hypothetical protein